jgi:2-amino-4-hydroxy-6-hydroxymethyldihydropteridine diphosphokinase
MSVEAYIGFGANLGDREATFEAASRALAGLPGVVLKTRSRLYETEPLGLSDGGPPFLNAVIAIETDLSPQDLMKAMRTIELDLGKDPAHRSDRSRLIDLDLLLYGEQNIQNDGLSVPHPRMHTRAFVLLPLAEVACDAMVPLLDRPVKDLLSSLTERDLKGIRLFGT